MEKGILGNERRLCVQVTQPNIQKRKLPHVMKLTEDEYKSLIQQTTQFQQNKRSVHQLGIEDIKRAKFQRSNYDFKTRYKRIISLNSDLQLNKHFDNGQESVTDPGVDQNQVEINLHEYLNARKNVNDLNKQSIFGDDSVNEVTDKIFKMIKLLCNDKNRVSNKASSNNKLKKEDLDNMAQIIKFFNSNQRKTNQSNNKIFKNRIIEKESPKQMKILNYFDNDKKNKVHNKESSGEILMKSQRHKIIKIVKYRDCNKKNEVAYKESCNLSKKTVKIVKLSDSENEKELCNNQSFNKNLKKVPLDNTEIKEISIENKSLNPIKDKLLITQIRNNIKTIELHKKVQKKYIPNIVVQNKISNININSIIVQQPAVKEGSCITIFREPNIQEEKPVLPTIEESLLDEKIPPTIVEDLVPKEEIPIIDVERQLVNQQLPVITNKSAVIRKISRPIIIEPEIGELNSKIIQRKSVSLPHSNLLKSKSILIKTNLVNTNSTENHQNANVRRLDHTYFNSKVNCDNMVKKIEENTKNSLLNGIEKEGLIFPVALKSSDSSDFEYINLLNTNLPNESEIEILGL